MVFYHRFIIYRFRTLHFLWALCGELVKLKGWTGGTCDTAGTCTTVLDNERRHLSLPQHQVSWRQPSAPFCGRSGLSVGCPQPVMKEKDRRLKGISEKDCADPGPWGGGPEVRGSGWEGQPAEAQLGCQLSWVCWGHISSAADPPFRLPSSPACGASAPENR